MMKLYEKIDISKPISQRFNDLAEYLFFHCCLEVEKHKLYFTELEFYLETQDDMHRDLFRHDAPEQKEDRKFYCHDSGVDITCGNGHDVWGGVLIRGLKDERGYHNGPRVSITKGIFPLLGMKEDYSSKLHRDILKKEVILKEDVIIPRQTFWQGPRFGLGEGRFPKTERGTKQKLYFKYAPYHYIIDAQEKGHIYKPKDKCAFVSAMLGKPMKDSQQAKDKAREWAQLYEHYQTTYKQ